MTASSIWRKWTARSRADPLRQLDEIGGLGVDVVAQIGRRLTSSDSEAARQRARATPVAQCPVLCQPTQKKDAFFLHT